MEAVAFFAFLSVLAWAFVAIERSRHAALLEIARLAAAADGASTSGTSPLAAGENAEGER